MGDKFGKRASDIDKTQEIEALILEEDNRSARMLALIVQNLNTNIKDLTIELRMDREAVARDREETARDREKLDKHILDHAEKDAAFAEHINTGNGAKMVMGWGMRIAAWIFGLIQMAVIGFCTYTVNAIQSNEVQHATMEQEIKQIQDRSK